jgi:hypothetical protein
VTEEYENYSDMEEAARRLLREWQDEEPAAEKPADNAARGQDDKPEETRP